METIIRHSPSGYSLHFPQFFSFENLKNKPTSTTGNAWTYWFLRAVVFGSCFRFSTFPREFLADVLKIFSDFQRIF
jgi:hypothetical protein